MADDAANQTPATATVIRVTDKQVRLRLDEANGGREVTKRVAVPEEARERLDGTTIPVVLHGTGARARVELADDWLTPAKPKRSRSRGGSKAKKADAAEAPPVGAAPAEEAPAKPRRKRTRGAAAEKDAAPSAEAITEAAPAEEATPKPKRGSRRRRSGGATDDAPAPEAAAAEPAAPEAQPAPVAAAPAPRDEAEVRERIAAAVELVRAARQPVAR